MVGFGKHKEQPLLLVVGSEGQRVSYGQAKRLSSLDNQLVNPEQRKERKGKAKGGSGRRPTKHGRPAGFDARQGK